MKKLGKMAKNGFTIPRKIRKRKNTRLKKRKKKKRGEREISFSNGNVFLSFPVPANFNQRTCLTASG